MPNFAYTQTGAGLVSAPGPSSGRAAHGLPSLSAGNIHLGVIGIVLVALLGLFLLDKGGVRFYVTVKGGKI